MQIVIDNISSIWVKNEKYKFRKFTAQKVQIKWKTSLI